jgi:hypothetical protein
MSAILKEKVEITLDIWHKMKKEDKRKQKNGTRFMRCKQTSGGGSKWVEVFWRR